MLKHRVIPCLLLRNGGLVKTQKFADPKYVGDPINAVKIFNEKESDELIVLDIDASAKDAEPDYRMIGNLAAECRMPLCYGGGIRSFRGFTFRGLGPFENNLALGGTFALFNTIEYQIPLLANDRVHWAFFVDHGTVERNVSIRDYRVSVGTGLRLNIPALGPLPLALDFAVPIVQGPGDHKQLFSLSVGLFGGP